MARETNKEYFEREQQRRMLMKFIRRDSMEKMMFAWVNCLRTNMPGVSIEKAITNFIKYHNLEDDLSVVGCTTTYVRMQREYIDYQRIINTQKKDGSNSTETSED